MRKFEYKAVPAPATGTKARGLKTTEERFALSLSTLLNEMAGEGWEYVRAETLPCDERKGLTGTQTTYQNVLVFKRFLTEAMPLTDARSSLAAAPEPELAHHASEPVVPRRVTTAPPEPGIVPSLGAARRSD